MYLLRTRVMAGKVNCSAVQLWTALALMENTLVEIQRRVTTAAVQPDTLKKIDGGDFNPLRILILFLSS